MAEDSNDRSSRIDRVRGLISNGAEIAGGAVGAALGFLATGPVGAAVLGAGGIVAAKAFKQMGEEVSERILGPREKVRVGGVLAIAASEIKNRIEHGERIRTDGFFDEKPLGRSDAEEVTEVLQSGLTIVEYASHSSYLPRLPQEALLCRRLWTSQRL